MVFPVFGKNSAKTNGSKQTFVGQPRNVCLEFAPMWKVQEGEVLARIVEELKLIPPITDAFHDRLESVIGCSGPESPLHKSIGRELGRDPDTLMKSQNTPDSEVPRSGARHRHSDLDHV